MSQVVILQTLRLWMYFFHHSCHQVVSVLLAEYWNLLQVCNPSWWTSLHVNFITDMIMLHRTWCRLDVHCDRPHDSGKFGDCSKWFLYCRKITHKLKKWLERIYPNIETAAFLWMMLLKSPLCWLLSSVQSPVDTGSSPELCPAWAPQSRSPSAPCSVCTCPNPSPSRAATWAAAGRTDLSRLPLQATQIHRRTAGAIPLLQVLQRPSPSHTPQQPFQHLNPVSARKLLTHSCYGWWQIIITASVV